MPSFPRDIKPQTVTGFLMPGALSAWGQSGVAQHRSTTQRGRIWRETFPPFNAQTANGRKLLATINYFWRGGIEFTIEHYLYATQLGGGTGTVLVNGASQTGASLVTDGWGGSNPVLRAGDLIRIAGISELFEIREDATHTAGAATLTIDPPIFEGGSPADNAAITYTGVTLNAYLAAEPNIPDAAAEGHGLIQGLTLTFREAV